MKTKITLSKEDFSTGRQRDPCRCPITQAIRRANPSVTIVIVQPYRVRIDDVLYAIPENASQFIIAYDSSDITDDNFTEFSFSLAKLQ